MVQSVSPKLFGRDVQLAEIRKHVAGSLSGQRPMVLLCGEAGVGKSRLLEEALQTPEAARFAQVRATCLQGDAAEPYSLARTLVIAAGGNPDDLNISPAPEAERQVRQVQQGLMVLLQAACGEQPLIVAVDDVHWSDSASLQVLLALALSAHPPLLLLSYRPEPLSPGLAAFLAEASRLRLATTIPLQPLAAADAARMIRAILGLQKTLPPGLLHEIMTLTEGIPFLVEELLHTFLKSGRLERQQEGWRFRRATTLTVPDSLRHAAEGRLLSLSSGVIAVAEQAAVAGQVVNVARLAHLSGLPDAELFAALRALVAAQVFVKREDGTMAFRHALMREAIRTRIPQAERQALHRRVAQALEADGDVAASTLAYHWANAGDIERAARHAQRAAEHAASLHGHHEAIAHYELTLAGGAGRREEILTAIGDHFLALGKNQDAIARYEEAQVGYQVVGNDASAAVLDLRIGLAYAQQRSRKEAVAKLQTAFASLPTAHAERWRAGLQLGLQQAASGDQEAAKATFREAQMAADINSTAQLRIVYELSGLRARHGEWAVLEEAARRVLREAEQQEDEALALRHDAHAALGTMAYYRGELQETLRQFTVCLQIAEQRGLRNDRALAHWNLATNALYHIGHWHEARQHLASIQALSVEGLAEAALTFEQLLGGAWEQALDNWLRDWPGMVESADLELQMAFGRRIADLLLALERHEHALQLLAPLLARLRKQRARSFELQIIPRQVEALARVNHVEALETASEGLQLARALGGRPSEGLLLRGRALALQQAAQWLDAFAGYEAAVTVLQELPMPYEVARTQRQSALARLARGRRGDRKRAAALLRRARQQFADLGATRDERNTDVILSSAGLADASDSGSGPLTAREQEVARLVTRGLSNAEIAEQLFITEKTAAYHIGNILTKLDFNSRVEIAVYMTRRE